MTLCAPTSASCTDAHGCLYHSVRADGHIVAELASGETMAVDVCRVCMKLRSSAARRVTSVVTRMREEMTISTGCRHRDGDGLAQPSASRQAARWADRCVETRAPTTTSSKSDSFRSGIILSESSRRTVSWKVGHSQPRDGERRAARTAYRAGENEHVIARIRVPSERTVQADSHIDTTCAGRRCARPPSQTLLPELTRALISRTIRASSESAVELGEECVPVRQGARRVPDCSAAKPASQRARWCVGSRLTARSSNSALAPAKLATLMLRECLRVLDQVAALGRPAKCMRRARKRQRFLGLSSTV